MLHLNWEVANSYYEGYFGTLISKTKIILTISYPSMYVSVSPAIWCASPTFVCQHDLPGAIWWNKLLLVVFVWKTHFRKWDANNSLTHWIWCTIFRTRDCCCHKCNNFVGESCFYFYLTSNQGNGDFSLPIFYAVVLHFPPILQQIVKSFCSTHMYFEMCFHHSIVCKCNVIFFLIQY